MSANQSAPPSVTGARGEPRLPAQTSRSLSGPQRLTPTFLANPVFQRDKVTATGVSCCDSPRVHVRLQRRTRPRAVSVQRFGAFRPAPSGDAARADLMRLFLPRYLTTESVFPPSS